MKNKTTFGTCHFPSEAAAVRYYSNYENNPRQAVKTKLEEKSIFIGKPIVCKSMESAIDLALEKLGLPRHETQKAIDFVKAEGWLIGNKRVYLNQEEERYFIES